MFMEESFPPKLLNKINRLALFVGYTCSNDCRFCVVADKRRYPDKTTEDLKRELAEAYADGAKEVVLTGGECTVRSDICDLVRYAKKIGFIFIQIQTNGRKFSSMEFCKNMLSAGMNEFSPALHGHTAELHDFLTRRPGSFRQTVLGIYNMKRLAKGRIRILTNTVVTKYNYEYLPQIAQFLIKLGVQQYQFAFVHALGNAGSSFGDVVPKKTNVMPYLKKGLDLGIKRGLRVMAEAIPLCLMKGYEKYSSEFYIPPTQVKEAGFTVKDFEKLRIEDGKVKFSQCLPCRYRAVCEGPWKEYPLYYGSNEFQPVLN